MNPKMIIDEIDEYSCASGLKPSTICERALGNARFYDRLQKRLERAEDEAERLREWFRKNPVPSSSLQDAEMSSHE